MLRSSNKLRKAFRPHLEVLENRWCPSASVSVSQGVMTIIGDGSTDKIVVADNGSGGVDATVYAANGTTVLAQASGTGIDKIKIDGAGGNDTIDDTLSSALTEKETLVLNLGGGSVKADLNFNAGVSSKLTVTIDGAASGNDTVETDFGALSSAARVNFTEDLGKGTSSGTVNFNDAVAAGSASTVTVNGGSGINQATIDFVGSVAGKVHVIEHLGSGTTTAYTTFSGGITAGANVYVQVDGGTSGNQANVDFGAATGAHLRIDDYLGTGTTGSQITFGDLSGDGVHVNVDAGKGSHQVTTAYGNLTSGTELHESDWLGGASDKFTVDLGGDVQTNAHADFEIYTHTGNDTVTVNAPSVDIDAGSSLGIHMHAEHGTKTLDVNYTGTVDGYLNVSSDAGRGNATLDDDLDIVGGTGTVNAVEHGGKGTDSLTLDVSGTTSGLSHLEAVVFTHSGNTVSSTSNVKVK